MVPPSGLERRGKGKGSSRPQDGLAMQPDEAAARFASAAAVLARGQILSIASHLVELHLSSSGEASLFSQKVIGTDLGRGRQRMTAARYSFVRTPGPALHNATFCYKKHTEGQILPRSGDCEHPVLTVIGRWKVFPTPL